MNKNTKIYYNGKLIEGKWQRFVFKVKRFFKRLFWFCIVLGIAYGIYWLGGVLNPAIVYTRAEVIKEVEPEYPILAKIAKCESPTGHYGKNGQVAVNGNDNGTVDVGKFMINTYYHGTKATEMGLNLWVEKDNETYAKYLYKTRGTVDWEASRKCWNK